MAGLAGWSKALSNKYLATDTLAGQLDKRGEATASSPTLRAVCHPATPYGFTLRPSTRLG